MSSRLESELQKIGLSEKEAKVYLAGLELGPSTAQSIAAKAVVNRPTTYVMIESLIKRGLMSSFEKGKKRYFICAEPLQLSYILNAKRREIDEQEKALKSLMTILQSVNPKQEKPLVHVFEGENASRVVQDYLLANTDEVLELVPLDVVRKYIPPIFSGDVRERFSKQFQIKSLYSSSGGPDHSVKPNVEYRYLDPEKFPFSCEVIIFQSKVVFSIFGDKQYSIVVNSEIVSQTLQTLFYSLWEKASKI